MPRKNHKTSAPRTPSRGACTRQHIVVPNQEIFMVQKPVSLTKSYYAFPTQQPTEDLVFQDPKTLRTLSLARSVARTSSTVLLSGESGVGKEVFARFIHDNSRRANQAFLGVNCASFPESLLESELFGHEKGAFSGAVKQRAGIFERANGGTLLLDEISEMPVDLQAKLLRVIQQRQFFRVGGSKLIDIDIRLIATTNRDLKQYVTEGHFRHDLYYRLNVFPIHIPSLRERRGDIRALVLHYGARLAHHCHHPIHGISPEAMALLESYDYSGNVRELLNILERAVILCSDGAVIEPEHILLEMDKDSVRPRSPDDFSLATQDLSEISNSVLQTTLSPPPESIEPFQNPPPLLQFRPGEKPLAQIQKEVILATLDRFQGNRTKTAEALGISARTIRNKLKKYGIDDF